MLILNVSYVNLMNMHAIYPARLLLSDGHLFSMIQYFISTNIIRPVVGSDFIYLLIYVCACFICSNHFS